MKTSIAIMRIWMLCAIALVLTPNGSQGEVRRALLIGISQYRLEESTVDLDSQARVVANRGWLNLDGPVNDVTAMAEVLVARFGFERGNIRVLTNGAASRDSILRAFRDHLLLPSKEGDVCVFYFSGHGSQVRNSDCSEADCRDETIVPADANRGVPDIRDKEWLRIFNDVLDRGAILTAFFDSCHSGSISRGLGLRGKPRFLKPDPRDPVELFRVDVEDPRGAPAERGALVFSAAQDFQLALEARDGQGEPYGAFTLALVKTLRSMPPGEPAEDVFKRVRALVQSEGSAQEPMREGSLARLAGPLFGGGDDLEPSFRVAVEAVENDGHCVVQGGRAVGLCTGSVLRKVRTSTSEKPVRVRVVSVDGLNRCTARVVEGVGTELETGDLLELDRWAGCDEPFLRVWIPQATLTLADLLERSRDLEPLGATPGIHWVEDPGEDPPTHVLAWDGGDWQLLDVLSGVSKSLGQAPSPAIVLENLPMAAADTVRFFHYLPVPSALADSLEFAPQNPAHPVQVTSEPANAHYWLVGRRQGNDLEYAWLLPNISRSAAQASSPLPVSSNWCKLEDDRQSLENTARRLDDLAGRIGKIRMWLQLEAPPDEGLFPYRLTFVNPTTGAVEGRSVVYDGESFQLALHADPRRKSQYVERRYVYVFAVDGSGQMRLLFPSWSNEGNRFPRGYTGSGRDSLIVIQRPTVIVSKPYGIDTYFLLSTREPLPDLNVLRSRPVRTPARGPEKPQDPLSRLLADIDSGARGMRTSTAVDWSLRRFSVRSMPQ